MITAKINKERIHSFDALRAVMMLLGVVLHSSETYNIGSSTIWPMDPNDGHLFQNYLSAIIHVFRMPIFFLVAGFFAAMLFYERSPLVMIKNRISRIVLPFIVFLFILHPVIIYSLDFTSEIFGMTLSGISTSFTFLPKITYHLWFLYYLILITLFMLLLALILRRIPAITSRLRQSYEWLFSKRLLTLTLFFIITFFIMVYRWDYDVPTPLLFTPDWGAFLFFVFFYTVGWMLFCSRHLLSSLIRYDWFFTVLGFSLFTVQFVWASYIDDITTGVIYALVTWLLIFGIVGLFVRYGNNYSSRMRYVSHSSYWIYLIHLPLTLLLPGLIVNVSLPAFGKFLVVLSSTSVLGFASYHFLVRSTFIGKFLNGRKYSKLNHDE
jgi:glucans biosynthesis protein C